MPVAWTLETRSRSTEDWMVKAVWYFGADEATAHLITNTKSSPAIPSYLPFVFPLLRKETINIIDLFEEGFYHGMSRLLVCVYSLRAERTPLHAVSR